jgi:hypothetical protein
VYSRTTNENRRPTVLCVHHAYSLVCTACILNCVYSRNTVFCVEQAYSIKGTVSPIMCTVGLLTCTAVLLFYVYSRPTNK